jgi:hypothetical protein
MQLLIMGQLTHHRIDMNLVIKVADFGLSQSLGEHKDYFRQDKTVGAKLPVKWLAPECLMDGVFSERSDVVCKMEPLH